MSQSAEKELAAAAAVKHVQSGMLVGLGSGSTSAAAVRLLGERVQREGLKIVGVPTSSATRALAEQVGIPLLEDQSSFQLDLAIDGADEATANGWLIKGGGGALLQERIIAAAAKRFLVMLDRSKIVERLGKFPLPVEVFRLGWRNVERTLRERGASVSLRLRDSQPFITDEGNYILDCCFPETAYVEADRLADTIRAIAGVADHGLFLDLTSTLIVARGTEVEEVPLR